MPCWPIYVQDKTFVSLSIVTGWGKISNNQNGARPVFSPVLRQVRLPVANNLCTTAPFNIDDTQLCAGGKKGNQNIYKRSF